MPRPVVTRLLLPLVVVLLVAACGGDESTDTTTSSSSSGSPSSSSSNSSSDGSSSSDSSGSELPEVDVTVTGKHPFVAKGTKGRCIVTADQFGFEMTDADYPGVGASFSVAELKPTDIKWAFTRDEVLTNSSTGGILAVTPDHKSIAIDVDLTGPPDGSVQAHAKGSITCP